MTNETGKKQESAADTKQNQPEVADNKMATNPNPRANENIEGAPFEKTSGNTNDVGSEITDGEGG